MNESERLEKQHFRWMKLGPWYAMFPMDFALEAIREHTQPGQSVLDPFMGRGTTLAAATMLGRNAAGIEINPIAWTYAKTKVQPASEARVLARLQALEKLALGESIPALPEFFSWCFCPQVLRFLLVARQELQWRTSNIDRTLMAIILVDLHGREAHALSNQMRQTKAMAPAYSVAWWKKNAMPPNDKDPGTLLRTKIAWRYRYGPPKHPTHTLALLGDSTRILHRVKRRGPYQLLLTSPPYWDMVNYNYDQWLRRWMLGGPEVPQYSAGPFQSAFAGKAEYERLLNTIFLNAKQHLTPSATVLVRTDARPFTLSTTLTALEKAFPEKIIQQICRPVLGKTQTQLFGDKSEKPGEVDLLLKS